MPEALRSALILDSLIGAVQANIITSREMAQVTWMLRAGKSGRLDSSCLMFTELRKRVIAACPLLTEESDVSEAATAKAPDGASEIQRCSDEGMKETTINSFGLSPEASHQGE